ncbi:metallo-beta-lactamase family protein RNA-specific [Candidatus Thiomargarita nelsonii]|uniref:Metallo-beta-lactamase family protein RNA-specific n=1 Tax=Candidatus Thiomargarita nelsonii TaxID=1003181 RepID=A0A176S652_9GAMM|nr:metallo-beta-lactamase family protein RNA-specific [Candidatus Thiomargarita nelsonii]
MNFEQLLTINDWQTHQRTVKYLQKTARPVIVIAASGMCTGGRIVSYLKALLEDKRTDILFVGYQGQGTIGRTIQKYGPRNGWVEIEDKRYTINAQVHTISGYCAHADQRDLVNFVKRMRHKPKEIRLVQRLAQNLLVTSIHSCLI